MASENRAVTPPSLAGAEWLARAETRAVMGAIEDGGFAARIVGGAVRNALLREPVKDIDIATPALPTDVMRLAEAAGLRALPTGIEHGTVTVIVGHSPFEVTTLRRDIETFGRHARVTFTTEWAEDARRRDFTMNALYCGSDGTIHDPLGGYPDLLSRHVRFIGDAHERIREDYLRILRFFRFTAEYAEGKHDPEGLCASIELMAGVDQLSGERIRVELLRLLSATAAVATLFVMDSAGVLGHALGEPSDVHAFARLASIEQELGRDPDPILRLAALAVLKPGSALSLRDRLKLSGHEFERLARMALPDAAFDPRAPEREACAFLYRHGTQAFVDGALLAWARSGDAPSEPTRRARVSLPLRWQAPPLPVRGSDVVALGVAAGPAVGSVLRTFEDWWISEGFPSDRDRIAAALARFARAAAET
jgi:poly(A) polymerase